MNRSLLFSACASLLCFSCAERIVKHTPDSVTSKPIKTATSLSPAAMGKDTLNSPHAQNSSLSRSEFTNGIEEEPPVAIPALLIDSGRQDIAQKPIPAPASTVPVFGGVVKLYTQRGFIDENIGRMLSPYPFEIKSSSSGDTALVAGYFQVKDVADKGVMLTLSSPIRSGDDRFFSAFDIVTMWSEFTKNHAEAYGLFRYASGIDQFIHGHDAVLNGFQIIDDKTIVIQFSKTDPQGLARIATSRLIPSEFKLGPYFVKNEKNNTLTLAANLNYPLGKPYLNSCEIKLGGDPNPFLSYSMRRFDAMTIFSLKDLAYARRMQPEQNNLFVLSDDRYFLSLAIKPMALRQRVLQAINIKQMLSLYIKAEGKPLHYIETDSARSLVFDSLSKSQISPAPATSAPFPILYTTDDPVSILIAEKVMADLTHSGFAGVLKGCIFQEYEQRLVKRDYGIAVGFAPPSIVTDPSERLRLATLWFNDEVNEQARIDSALEIPLFTIKTYLLSAKKILFAHNDLMGMFVAP